MNSAVSLRELNKAFGRHQAVQGITLEIPRTSIFGLLGPNGAGKTTTIRMIMDIIRPDSGEVRVLGSAAGDGTRERVGYLPEERGLYRKAKVLEMLEYQGSIKGMRLADARQEASGWLDRLGLAEWKDKKVEELSKGMQQKVQLVGALLGQPELLILDEPFAGLDPVNQNLFKEVILELNRNGTTIIFSTHVMESAEKLCKEIALINRGRVVLHGSLPSVKAGFGKNSVLLEIDGEAGFIKDLPTVADIDDYGSYLEVRLETGADPGALLPALVGRVGIRRFEIVAPTLHNIFIEQVGQGATDA